MREILFRGKRIDNGEWIYGSLLEAYDTTLILKQHSGEYGAEYMEHIEDNAFAVDPETIGQYTGLADKNGKKIWEGDIVNRKGKRGEVVFDESEFSLKLDGCEYIQHGLLVKAWLEDIEVIGNIHDNPELLKEKK